MASTVVLSAMVVVVVGWLLLQQTEEGLVEQRREAVVAEVANESAEVIDWLNRVPGTDSDTRAQLQDLVDPIIQRGAARGFEVVLAGPVGSGRSIAEGSPRFSPGLDLRSVPASLQEQMSEQTDPQWTFTRIRVDDGTILLDEPGIAVGTQFVLPADQQTYTLYYLFSMQEAADTLTLVARAALTAAGVLMVLVAGVTWLVTRQVVTPIRMARRVAERLSAGDLQERLRVTGEDDLARLATSFNQMAGNLQRQIRQLEELSRLQRRFVADVSHELRTPLTTVRMAGDMLHDARLDFDPATARAAELLQTELDRFETLLTDLLEISRFDAGAAHLETTDVNLVDVVNRVVDLTSGLAARRGISVVVRAPDTPCLAEADVRRVERIVRNLVGNAIDHAGATDVVVTIAASEDSDDTDEGTDGGAAAIGVRDYGVGLTAEESAMVFNRFWRADPARARTSGGTGLGLSIALEDTHLHGGWLQAWGRPGGGAHFRLTLPRHLGATLRRSPLPLVPVDAKEAV